MVITTFGNKTSHHISIDGTIHGPFSTKLEVVDCAHKNNIFLHKMAHSDVEHPVKDMYYTVWTEKE